MKIDIVITRHRPLVELLRERGIIDDSTPVLEHAAIADVTGKHVLGVLPHHLSSRCASITEVPMALTQADREAMTRGDLTLERTREVAGEPVTYTVRQGVPDQATEMAECHRRALVHASPFTWPPNMKAAQGVVEYAGAEGLDHAQVDIYAKGRPRYRTISMGGQWSPWLTSDGGVCKEQDEPCANARGWWAREGTVPLSEAPDGARVEIWDLRIDLTDAALVGIVTGRDDEHVLVQIEGQQHPCRHQCSEPCKVLG